MSEQELAESIHWEAEQYIPFDIQEVNLDYQILDEGAAGGNMDILLVAAKKDKINDYMSVITQAGRNPVVMDVDAFALQNAYEMNYGIDPGPGRRPGEHRSEPGQHQYTQRRGLDLHP